MTEIRFYHLTKTPQDRALPQIAMKAWQAGHRLVIKAQDEAEVTRMNATLWTFNANVFLPHGSKEDGNADKQPIWLTAENDNPNGAGTLILTAGTQSDDVGSYELCCAMLDGTNPQAVEAARVQWKAYKDAGHDVSYWQQTDTGWEKKA